MRKYNKTTSCDRTPFGAWKIIVQTLNDQFHIRSYFDCSRREAIHKVRETDFDKELGLQFDQPPPPKKRTDSSHER